MESVTVHYNLVLSYTVFEATTAMEDLKAALNEHVDLVSDLFEKLSAELRSGFGPAVDNFIGFFHAIDWKVCFFNLNNTIHLLYCCLCLVVSFWDIFNMILSLDLSKLGEKHEFGKTFFVRISLNLIGFFPFFFCFCNSCSRSLVLLPQDIRIQCMLKNYLWNILSGSDANQ